MLNSGKKINILTLVLSGKKNLNDTKNHNPPPCKLNGRSLNKHRMIIYKNIFPRSPFHTTYMYGR